MTKLQQAVVEEQSQSRLQRQQTEGTRAEELSNGNVAAPMSAAERFRVFARLAGVADMVDVDVDVDVVDIDE